MFETNVYMYNFRWSIIARSHVCLHGNDVNRQQTRKCQPDEMVWNGRVKELPSHNAPSASSGTAGPYPRRNRTLVKGAEKFKGHYRFVSLALERTQQMCEFNVKAGDSGRNQ